MQVPFIQKAIAATVGVVTLLGAIAPEAVQAATITYTSDPISYNQNTGVTDIDTGAWGTSSLPYFDAALGTLNNVSYRFLVEVKASAAFTNILGDATSIDGRTSSTKSSSFFNVWGYLKPSGVYYNNVPDTLDAYAVLPKIVVPVGGTVSNSSTNSFISQFMAANPSDFGGTGTYAVAFGSYYLHEILETGEAYLLDFVGTGEANNLRATVVYDYTPTDVPTPALLPGLIGLGFTAIRKRKSLATA
jgi:hypothetical protein